MRIDPKAVERALWTAGLTRQALAERSGFSGSYIGKILAGHVQGTPPTAVRLAEALGVEVGDLITDDEPEREPAA